jgi:uncharacterized membrane protein YoaK (UPF0700 family)
MIDPFADDVRSERALAICLALIAGYVDAYGIRALGAYVSFMSGNSTSAGSLVGEGRFAAILPFAAAIACYVAGAVAGTWLTHSGLRQPRRLLLGVVAAALTAIAALHELGAVNAVAGVAVLALAMGMMNTAESQVGGETVGLTFMTGDLHRLGGHLALAWTRAPLPGARGPRDSHARRAALLASVWAGFFAGAVLGGMATAHGGRVLLLPAVALATLSLLGRSDRAPTAALRPARLG